MHNFKLQQILKFKHFIDEIYLSVIVLNVWK